MKTGLCIAKKMKSMMVKSLYLRAVVGDRRSEQWGYCKRGFQLSQGDPCQDAERGTGMHDGHSRRFHVHLRKNKGRLMSGKVLLVSLYLYKYSLENAKWEMEWPVVNTTSLLQYTLGFWCGTDLEETIAINSFHRWLNKEEIIIISFDVGN